MIISSLLGPKYDHAWWCSAVGSARKCLWLSLVVVVLGGCKTTTDTQTIRANSVPPQVEKSTARVTFVQWTDPHLFDAGSGRHDEGVEEEALDNRSALHWAVLETNRLALSEHPTVDFVVITGDFGLENVQLPERKGVVGRKCECPRHETTNEGPVEPVTLDQAADEVARELSALVVKRIYLVPGDNDICHEDPADMHRWAEFVFALTAKIQSRHDALLANLSVGYPNQKNDRLAVPTAPQVVDLTYTLRRLYDDGDPRVVALFPQGSAPEKLPTVPASVNGFYLIGLNSAYFKPHDGDLQKRADQQSKRELEFLISQFVPHASHLIFTHIPDIDDPRRDPAEARKSMPDKASSWKIATATRKNWHDDILKRGDVVGVFAGHFHATRREIYPHNFDYGQKPDQLTAGKFWIAPPLSATQQWMLPQEKSARGLLLVSVAGNGAVRASPETGETVLPTPIWYSTSDQKTAAEGDSDLIAARAFELDGKWDQAAEAYARALKSSDARVRATATRNYSHDRLVTRKWWWQGGYYFPPLRWVFVHPRRTELAIPVLLLFLLIIRLLRQIKVFSFLGLLVKFLVVPPFRGKAIMNTPVAITKDATADEFGAQIQAATEEIRQRLLREQENWAARQIALLSPSSGALDQLVGSIPDLEKAKVGTLVKFLFKILQLFRWSVDSGLAVFADPNSQGSTNAAGSSPPKGVGQLSGYAVLQWSVFIKNSWRQTIPLEDATSQATLARSLATLILGEAFARRRF
jgi:3',5'-cyclic AMP phosphodiesterase CpdA